VAGTPPSAVRARARRSPPAQSAIEEFGITESLIPPREFQGTTKIGGKWYG
jgi:hypothetical protein